MVMMIYWRVSGNLRIPACCCRGAGIVIHQFSGVLVFASSSSDLSIASLGDLNAQRLATSVWK